MNQRLGNRNVHFTKDWVNLDTKKMDNHLNKTVQSKGREHFRRYNRPLYSRFQIPSGASCHGSLDGLTQKYRTLPLILRGDLGLFPRRRSEGGRGKEVTFSPNNYRRKCPRASECFYGHYCRQRRNQGRGNLRGFSSPTLEFIFVPIHANTVCDVAACFLNLL